MILRGLNKGQKKEIYFCNKAKIFSSFLLILMHVIFIMQNSRSLKEAFDWVLYRWTLPRISMQYWLEQNKWNMLLDKPLRPWNRSCDLRIQLVDQLAGCLLWCWCYNHTILLFKGISISFYDRLKNMKQSEGSGKIISSMRTTFSLLLIYIATCRINDDQLMRQQAPKV